jgi:hypothetical protein
MVGKKKPCCARTCAWACRSAACAAVTVGLAFIAAAIKRSSFSECNMLHHCSGICMPSTKRWASPPCTGADAVSVGSGLGVYAVASGALGVWKLGPTAHAVRTPQTARAQAVPANGILERMEGLR